MSGKVDVKKPDVKKPDVKYTDYVVCESDERGALVKEVKKYLAMGYIPAGGISYNHNHYCRYSQAMVLSVQNPTIELF